MRLELALERWGSHVLRDGMWCRLRYRQAFGWIGRNQQDEAMKFASHDPSFSSNSAIFPSIRGFPESKRGRDSNYLGSFIEAWHCCLGMLGNGYLRYPFSLQIRLPLATTSPA